MLPILRLRPISALGVATACLFVLALPAAGADRAAGKAAAPARDASPAIHSIEPTVAGVGSLIRIRGANLGSDKDATVVFGGDMPSTWVDKHAADEIVVAVPIGATAGPVRVVLGAAVEDFVELDGPARAAALGALPVATSADALRLVAPFATPTLPPDIIESPDGGVLLVKNRLILELHDFLGFEDALEIGWKFGGRLFGFSGPSNSYFFELADAPKDHAALHELLDAVAQDKRIREVSPDMALELKQVRFAPADNVNSRYREVVAAGANVSWQQGREGAWHTDRIQAPAAWNLIERFRPPTDTVHVAVVDTGCDQAHAEFTGVTLTQIAPAVPTIRYTIAGDEVELPTVLVEQPYNRGDPAAGGGHGTAVCSIIGAEQGRIINGTDRGICGVIAGSDRIPYTMQIHRGGSGNFPTEPGEAGDTYTLTDFLPAINAAAITGCKVLNASWGQPRPVNPATHADRNIIRISLRKLARELNRYRTQLLLCVAAGNEGLDPASFNGGEITPFEDFNLNNTLDAGEDVDGDGALDNGNYVGASLGTLSNVITVGAIIGMRDANAPNFFYRDDERWVDGVLEATSASNWGTRVAGGAVDAVVHLAAPGGREMFTASTVANGRRFQIGAQWYTSFGGTSAATPMVTGSAATLFSLDGTLTPAAVKQRLIETSFPIRTTDTNGANLDWNTLKLGAAVRRLMVDRGTITNDQAWTGTSRLLIIPTGNPNPWDVTVGEVRQDPGTRRSFLFRTTVIKTYNIDRATSYSAAISPSGTQFNGDVRNQIWRYNIETDADFQIISPPARGHIWDRIPLAVLPNETLMIPWTIADADCAGFPFDNAQVEIWRNNIVFARGAAAPANHKFWWRPYETARPDNAQFYAGLLYADLTVNPAQPCEITGQANGDGGALLAVPEPGGVAHTIPGPPAGAPYRGECAWSPDGRLFLGRPTAAGDYQVRRLNPGGAVVWTNAAAVAGPWAPDGSEVIVGFTTRRRNGNDPIAIGGIERYFSWTW